MPRRAMEANEAKAPDPKAHVQTFGRKLLEPGSYTLDIFSPVWKEPLTINEQQSTFTEVLNKLQDSKIKRVPDIAIEGRYVTEEGEIQLGCGWPLANTVRTLIEFVRRGIDPFAVTWFYYDHDSSVDLDHHRFFAVHDGKMVMESCVFNSEEPLILKRRTVEVERIWQNKEDFEEAFEIYWYRRFYIETMMGQLMVLRPDEPILHHYERPQPRDAARKIQSATIMKMYRLLLVSLPLLAAIAFPFLKEFMTIAALALGVSFMGLCWETRKLDRP